MKNSTDMNLSKVDIALKHPRLMTMAPVTLAKEIGFSVDTICRARSLRRVQKHQETKELIDRFIL